MEMFHLFLSYFHFLSLFLCIVSVVRLFSAHLDFFGICFNLIMSG